MKKIPPIFSSPSIATCGSNPYNPPRLPSYCSLTPLPPPLNYQFSLIPYFSPPSNLFPLLSHFSLIASFASLWIGCNKFQPKFIFPRCLQSNYVSYFSFFLILHYYYTCFHYSYMDNNYNNNKYFSSIIPMTTMKMHIWEPSNFNNWIQIIWIFVRKRRTIIRIRI